MRKIENIPDNVIEQFDYCPACDCIVSITKKEFNKNLDKVIFYSCGHSFIIY